MATIKVDLIPFTIPTSVTVKQKPGLRQDGMRLAPQLKLSELSPDELNAMCEEFRDAVFEAAGYVPTKMMSGWVDGGVMPGSQEALNRR